MARRWFEEVWNQRRTETVHELVSAEGVSHTEEGDVVGPEPFLAYHAQMLRALPDLKVVVEGTVAEGDSVVVRWLATATHTGEYRGQRPTGKPVRFRGMTWVRYRDGKMVEGWDCWNIGGLVQQLAGETS